MQERKESKKNNGEETKKPPKTNKQTKKIEVNEIRSKTDGGGTHPNIMRDRGNMTESTARKRKIRVNLMPTG